MYSDKYEIYQLKAELCKAFSDPKRLMIIDILRHGESTVNEVSKAAGLQQAVVSRNLAILRHSGVVKTRHHGTKIYYRLTDEKIIQACDLVHNILLGQIESQKNLSEELTTRK